MSAKADEPTITAELLQTTKLPMTADAILHDFSHYFGRTLGRRSVSAKAPFVYQALVYATRDRLMERWRKTHDTSKPMTIAVFPIYRSNS